MTFWANHMNINLSVLQILELLLRIAVACFCGFCIGFERSKRYKEAGVRTHVIVCCASALIMIVSKYGFVDLAMSVKELEALSWTRNTDPARLAAQVVSGISFLGAGVIFKNGSTIKGLTTAAGLWATAGIGLAIGCGGSMYWIGVVCTILIAVLQIVMHKFKIGGDAPTTRLSIEVSDNTGFGEKLSEILGQWHAKVLESKVAIGEDGSAKYDITLRTFESMNADEIMKVISSVEVIKSISYATSE